MYSPKHINEAYADTFSVKEANALVFGTDPTSPILFKWCHFQALLNSLFMPESAYQNVVVPQGFEDKNPANVGQLGTVWVSRNFAAIIKEAMAAGFKRSPPCTPKTTFWENMKVRWPFCLEPSGNYQEIGYQKGWLFVTSGSDWADSERVAVMLYPAEDTLPVATSFVNSVLAGL